MSLSITKHIMQIVAGSLLLACVSQVWADLPQDRTEGIAWLLQNQNGDGSWGKDGAKVAATAEALAALRNAGAASGFLYSRAISWLANARTDSVDSLARKIIALEAAGFNTVELGLVDQLLSLRNPQMGWGAFNGHSSGFPDTALALQAILSSEITYPELTTSLGLIRSGQTSGDNGWSYVGGNQGATLKNQIMPSAYNIVTLSQYQGISSSGTNVTRGVNWLINLKQQPDGSFLEDSTITTGSVHKTALGYLAIKAAKDAGVVTGFDVNLTNAQNYILSQQNLDGSWGSDAFSTALALRTLPTIVMTDTDGDGIPDDVEVLIGTDALVADGRDLLDANGLDPDNLQDSGMTVEPLVVEILRNQYFTYTPAISGGIAPFIWQVSSGSLPSGINLQSAASGTIAGTPTVPSALAFSMLLQDANTKNLIVPGHIRVLATNDFVTDTDQDGAPSTFELTKGFDPLDANSTPVLDSDGDGVNDWLDRFPSDPTEWADNDGDGIGDNADPDDDNDGMSDSYENRFGLNRNNPSDAALDSDGDGLTNLQESRYYTNPFAIDTDGDGIDDATEIAQGRNPNIDDALIPAIMAVINSLLLN